MWECWCSVVAMEVMSSFVFSDKMKFLIHFPVSIFLWVLGNRGEDGSRNQTRFADLGELEQPAPAFHHDDAVDLSPSIRPFLSLDV